MTFSVHLSGLNRSIRLADLDFEDFLEELKLSESQYEGLGPQTKVELLKVYVEWLKIREELEK